MEVCCISCREMYFPHDSRRICKECCDGDMYFPHEKLLKKVNAVKAKVDFLRLSSSQDHVSNSKSFADVVLIASNSAASAAPIPAHKFILMSRSPVFRAMFENNTEESRSSRVKISNVSYETLQTFIEYLYTGKACLDEQMACDLFVLSDQYQVMRLKIFCEKFLVNNLSLEKSLVAYVFAQQYNAKKLGDAALLNIIDNMEEVTKGKDNVEIVKKNPHLISKMYEEYFSKKVVKTFNKSKTN
ncbi:hypothetical protein EUTSA_v10023183mg [Eutrema salsugineum]|uniref:BTB domain-containing protein n=2 Tax=Eutrema salsugineum TaxID=72664 RepID=V4LJT4_EUTSA|nr:hypothetical protein EUTSA_v10023183mg [Eutrema salsugineum]